MIYWHDWKGNLFCQLTIIFCNCGKFVVSVGFDMTFILFKTNLKHFAGYFAFEVENLNP